MKLILFRTFHSLIILTIVLFLSSCSDSVSKKEVFYATKGFLDLKNWDYHRDPIIPLDGDWEFYWKEFYSKDEIPNQSKEQIDYMLIPSDWNGKMIGTTELTGEGYATYRLNINLPENLYEEISINISRAPESFVLFANGKKNTSARKTRKIGTRLHPIL